MKLFKTLVLTFLTVFSFSVAAKSFKTERWVTPNGVKVVFHQAMEVPMLNINLAFAAGSAYDGTAYGTSALTSQLLNQGNAGQNATAIAEALEQVGAQFNVEESRDMITVQLQTLTDPKALAQATKTFAQIVSHPDFPDEAFDRAKKQLLMSIKQVDESPDDVAEVAFFQKLYQQHPYAHPVIGTQESMSNLNKNQIINFYHQFYVSNNAVLVLVGAIDSQKAHELAEQITTDIPKGNPASAIVKATQLPKQEEVHIPFPSSQTIVRIGQVGIDHHNPNYFPLIVGNYILGGGSLVSELAIEVREKRGLTYGVDSQIVPMPGQGPFVISLSTKNNQSKEALKVTLDTIKQFIANGPNQQELQEAKDYLTGSFPLSLASNRNIANILLRITFYHLPDNYLDTYIDKINKVTTEEIKQAFKQLINPDQLLLITVGQS